jgi:hypothetical protein
LWAHIHAPQTDRHIALLKDSIEAGITYGVKYASPHMAHMQCHAYHLTCSAHARPVAWNTSPHMSQVLSPETIRQPSTRFWCLFFRVGHGRPGSHLVTIRVSLGCEHDAPRAVRSSLIRCRARSTGVVLPCSAVTGLPSIPADGVNVRFHTRGSLCLGHAAVRTCSWTVLVGGTNGPAGTQKDPNGGFF